MKLVLKVVFQFSDRNTWDMTAVLLGGALTSSTPVMEYACPFTRPVLVFASDSAELLTCRKPDSKQTVKQCGAGLKNNGWNHYIYR